VSLLSGLRSDCPPFPHGLQSLLLGAFSPRWSFSFFPKKRRYFRFFPGGNPLSLISSFFFFSLRNGHLVLLTSPPVPKVFLDTPFFILSKEDIPLLVQKQVSSSLPPVPVIMLAIFTSSPPNPPQALPFLIPYSTLFPTPLSSSRHSVLPSSLPPPHFPLPQSLTFFLHPPSWFPLPSPVPFILPSLPPSSFRSPFLSPSPPSSSSPPPPSLHHPPPLSPHNPP